MTPQARLIPESVYPAILDAAPHGVLVFDASRLIRQINPAGERLFGHSPGELVGKSIDVLIPCEVRPHYQEYLASYFENPLPRKMGSGTDKPVSGVRKDGSTIFLEIHLSAVEASHPKLVVAFVMDLTERRMREAMRDPAFELSPDLMCATDKNGLFQQINPAFERMLGWTSAEVQGKNFLEFVHPDDRERTQAELYSVARGNDLPSGFENRYVTRDGSVRWLEWTTRTPCQGEDFIFSAARDVTEEKLLEEREQELIALIEQTPDFIGLASPDASRVLYVNRAGREMLGLPPLDQLRKMRVIDLGRNDVGFQHFREVEKSVMARGFWSGEATYYHYVTGEPVPVDVNTFVVPDQSSGKPLVWATVARDLRERKRAEKRLRALTAQLLAAQEDERRRIARELHDGVTQDLASLGIELGLLRKDIDQPSVRGRLAEFQEKIIELSTEIRQLAHEFHPGVLEHAGLVAALEVYTQEISRFWGMRVEFIANGVPDNIPREISGVLYRIAQEALRNVNKHAKAQNVGLSLDGSKENGFAFLRLSIIDDGVGFAVDEARNSAGLGLLSIEERARLVQARVSVESLPGEGTRVEVQVKLPETAP